LDILPLEKIYEVIVGGSSFKYNKDQLPFISPSVFNHFLSSNKPFIIENQSNLNDLVLCYTGFDSLFRSKTEVVIDKWNVSNIKTLGKSIGNTFLIQLSNKVTQKNSQVFSLNSEHLSILSDDQISSFNDSVITINNQRFYFNSSLFSCISDKKQEIKEIREIKEISISEEHFPCFVSFFDIFKGFSFEVEYYNSSSFLCLIDTFNLSCLFERVFGEISQLKTISEAITFLSYFGFENKRFEEYSKSCLSFLVNNFERISFEYFDEMSNEQVQILFSSSEIQMENEDFLFEIILNMIEKKFSRIILIQSVFLGFVSYSLLKEFIENIPIDKVYFEIFEMLQERLYSECPSNYSDRWRNQKSILSGEEFSEIDQLIKFKKKGYLIES
jgi:hypothetical protein